MSSMPPKCLRALLFLLCLAVDTPKTEGPQTFAQLEEVPVGVAASSEGRVFISFSRAMDRTAPFSVAELKDGKPVEFPAGFKQDEGVPLPDRLLSVQAVVVDAKNRLWILDSSKIGARAIEPGTAKLIAYDLGANKEAMRITFPADIAGKNAFLNDVRIDLGRGLKGTAYVTDASTEGPTGIVVVDLESGAMVRRLDNHPSTRPDERLVLKVEGEPLLQKEGPGVGLPLRLGIAGLALSADGKHLYYSPLTSHHLYRVSADAIADQTRSEEEVRKSVEDLGDKGFASEGIACDAQDRLYVTDVEHSAVHRRAPDGSWAMIVQAVDLRWPGSLALLPDGRLLITATQLDRTSRFHGKDLRHRPFKILTIQTDSRPLRSEPPKQARPSRRGR